jgi:Protein of unknown function (DUF3467)
MMTEPDSERPVARELQNGADAVVYANWVRVDMTPYDIALDLGYHSTPEPPARFPVRVIMTWEHARDLRGLLDESIKRFEADIRPIREEEAVSTPARDLPGDEPQPAGGR